MADTYGYRRGVRNLVTVPVDASSSAISVGDAVIITAGYAFQAAAGDIPHGVATAAATVPAADGETSVTIDVSDQSIYEYPPDAGTVTQALVGKKMDLGGPRSINIDASTDDGVMCVAVDTDANTLLVQFDTKLAFTGVV